MANAYITLSGNIGGEVKNDVTPNGSENIKFSVAVNQKRGTDETTTWFNVTAWSGTAKGLTTLAERGILASGARVVVNGTLAPREYQDRNGVTRTSLDINAAHVDLISPPKNQQPQGNDSGMNNVPF